MTNLMLKTTAGGPEGMSAQGPLWANVSTLRCALMETRELLGSLVTRIQPVLSSSPPVAESPSSVNKSPTMEGAVSCEIREIIQLVSELQVGLRYILENLEI